MWCWYVRRASGFCDVIGIYLMKSTDGAGFFIVTVLMISMFHYNNTICSSFTFNTLLYVGNSISKLQIQAATYVFELSAGNCHR